MSERRRRVGVRSLAAGMLALAAGVALAADEPAPGAGPFPTPEMLDQLGEQTPPAVAPGRLVSVDRWTLQGPFPERVGEVPITAPGAFEQALVEVAEERAGLVVASRAMRCAAREFGVFFVQHGALPGGVLRRFILGRCGVTGGQVGFGYFYDDVPPDASSERVFEVWGSEVRRLVRSGLGPGPRAVGIWFGRNENRGLVLLISSERRARLTPLPATPDESGRVRVQGELLTPAGGIFGAVTRGALGWEDCEPAADVALPRFDLSCPVEPSDETAWLAVSVRRPGRLLGESVVDLLARPGGGEARTWTRRSFGPAHEVSGPEEFRKVLVGRVNELRRSLGHEPLALELEESRTAGRLTPIYFGSHLGMAPMEYGDMVALGLMAGWKVKGVIRDGSMGGSLANGTRDVDRWLADALAGPGLRSVLLDPARTRLAVGSLVSAEPEAEFVAAVVASYELFGTDDAVALRQDFYEQLDRAYDARDMRFPKRERTVEAVVARELLRIANGETSPEKAFQAAMQESSARLGVPVRGWLLHGEGVEDVVVPEELFSEPAARIAAGVTHVKPPGSAWGRTVIFLVAAPEGRLRTAQADPGKERHARR